MNDGLHKILGSCEHSDESPTGHAALSRSVGEGELSVSDGNHYFSLMHHVEVGSNDSWRFGIGGQGPSINCKVELWRL